MSASSAFSGKSAEPIVTDPGCVGNAPDEPDEPDEVEAGEVAGDCEVLLLPPLALLPLLPHAARASRPALATRAMDIRFMSLLERFRTGSSGVDQLRLHGWLGRDPRARGPAAEPAGHAG